nr:RIKEN cDNA 2810405F18 [Haemonchus contortus]
MLNDRLLIRRLGLHLRQLRFKTVKFKPKIAKAQALKTPSMVALDHCDFYYGPMFGKHWPSIRLGLLSPNKYVAVMNTFSRDCAVHEEFLEQSSTIDLLAKIRGKTAAERIEEKRQRVNSIAKKETESALKKMDSAIGLHREYFAYDETVDAKDVLAQVIECKYRTSALEKKVQSQRERRKARTLDSLTDILDEVSESLEECLQSQGSIRAQASAIIRTVTEMKEKLAAGAYGPQAVNASASGSVPTNAPRSRSSIVEATTSGYTL